MPFSLNDLHAAITSHAAAFRCVTEYQPAGGPGDKVFPPTYEGGKYATETRVIDGEPVDCVILDSVQSQANRNEQALLEAVRAKRLSLPLLVTHFDDDKLLKRFTVTSLDAPHRAADAIFRDCTLDGAIFRKSDKGRVLDTVDVRNATGLFGLNPTALIFGLWDSTGPRGALGAKFQRALVSEFVGINAIPGVKTSSRIDPAAIEKRAGPVFRTEDGDWTLDEDKAVKVKGKPALFALSKGKKLVGYEPKSDRDVPDAGRPSKINHGNVTPGIDYAKNNGSIVYDTIVDKFGKERKIPRLVGGFTITKATQTTVLSLATLRRLRFPLNGSAESDPAVDTAARTALAAIGLAAATLTREEGADLRSRCQLVPVEAFSWELLDRPGQEPKRFELTGDEALDLCSQAIDAAKQAGLPWDGEIRLQPSDKLIELVRRSQTLAATKGGEDA